MNKILLVSGHPDFEKESVANRAAFETLTKLLPEAEVNRLDVLYPNYIFDVEKEQAKLVEADVIVFQFPIFWYGMPALLQKWIEDVFLNGFSHGPEGKALVGKKLVLLMTAGAPESYYKGETPVSESDLLLPIKGIVAASGMELSGYEILYGVSYGTRINEDISREYAEKARETARKVVELVKTLENNDEQNN